MLQNQDQMILTPLNMNHIFSMLRYLEMTSDCSGEVDVELKLILCDW